MSKKEVNEHVRQELRSNGIPLWRVADALHVHENTVIRMLRHELNDEQRQRVLNAIEKVRAEA